MKTSRTFLDAIAHRRTYYALKNESPISDDAIREIVECTTSMFLHHLIVRVLGW